VADVVLEEIYKSFPTRRGESSTTVSVMDSGVAGATPTAITKDRSQTIASASNAAEAKTMTVLRQINLQIKDGEFMVLVGPSGCGKSTLLRMIAGLDFPTGGSIRVGDRTVTHLPPKERDIAMVFQSYALYPHMTVFDNLAFGLRRTPWQASKAMAPSKQGWVGRGTDLLTALTKPFPKTLRYRSPRERQIEAHVLQVAAMLQIEGLLNRFPKQLSGGQKQRVALGRAMARNPQVFLMDEPLSNLDAKLRTQTRAQIVKLQRQLGTTTIYVTHDQTEAMTMGDRIAVMNGGVIQQLAAPLDLYNHPANRFVAAFIGSPPMNFFRVQVREDSILEHPCFQWPVPKDWVPRLADRVGQRLDLGVRPEHLNIAEEAKHHIPIQVELVEALGHETFLAFSLPDRGRTLPEDHGLMNARIPAEQTVQPGDRLYLAIEPERIHLFDADSGDALP
jgi:multiple sugar transport system ATP-binding protein